MKLNQALIEAEANGKQQRYWDVRQPGAGYRLGMRISAKGKRTLVLRRKGHRSDIPLGDAPQGTTLAQARKQAEDAMAIPADFAAAAPGSFNRRGAVIIEARSAQPAVPRGPTVAEAFTQFFAHCDERIGLEDMKPKTVVQYRAGYRAHIHAQLGAMGVADVRRAHVKAVVDSIKAPYQRNRVLGLLSTFFNVCDAQWDYRDGLANPVIGISKAKERPRKRHLSPAEYKALGVALDEAETREPAAAQLLKFLCHSPRRVTEARLLKWADVNRETTEITLHDPKNGEEQMHPLPSAAWAIVASRKQHRHNEYVFTNHDYRRTKLSYATAYNLFQEVIKAAGLPGIRIHDLRRSWATTAIDMREPADGVECALGHLGNTVLLRHYATWKPDRDMVERVSRRVAAMMRGEPTT